ncbi:neutral amino acid transporter-like protein [Trichoderma sp. SZMC 28015]
MVKAPETSYGVDRIETAIGNEEEGTDWSKQADESDFEVFRREEGAVDFRTVTWPHASVIFLKYIFATGVLSIPSCMFVLGAFPGAINVVAWTMLNTYCAIIQGNFRNSHPRCHSIADMAQLVGGPLLREVVSILFLLAYIICAASGILGVSEGLNALSDHAICTQWFTFVATVIVAALASVRKFEKMAWLAWLGFGSAFVAVLIVVIGVTRLDRPAAAPQTGDFDLGFHAIGSPTFVAGVTAAATIFCSSAATSAFLPVISEMKKPKDYPKAVYLSMTIVTTSYLAFSLVMYRWCGQWIASPSLGSAGPVIKKVAYGVGIIGLCVSACLYVHIGSKYLFVRVLRNSPHLQLNSVIHWATWFSITAGVSAVSFVVASGIPIFNYILALAGSLCFAPLAISLPAYLWLHDHRDWRVGGLLKTAAWTWNAFLVLVGAFMTVGATYGVIQEIINAYADGTIGSAFSCADNSNSS